MASTIFGVNVSDIEDRWRQLGDEETSVALILIEDADLKLSIRRPSLAADIAANLVDGRLAVMAIVDVVIRVMTNPECYKSTSISADGSASASYFGSEVLRPRVFFNNDDLSEIDRASDDSPTGYTPIRSRVTSNRDYY